MQKLMRDAIPPIGIIALGLALLLIPPRFATAQDSPVSIGGALGVNWVYGDYDGRRGENLGDVDLEIFRLNADLNHNNLIGRVEYRWYDGYSMMHTAWLGYQSDDFGTVRAGIVRVPFGPGNYGVSSSWYFDQHFYVGLIDDMDLGVRWTTSVGGLDIDLAYFFRDEGHWDGESLDSSRYNYDPVTRIYEDIGEAGFKENGQLNVRAVYPMAGGGDIGASLQYGQLEGTNIDDSGANHFAASVHGTTSFGDLKLVSQLSYYKYDITDDTPWETGDLILVGAYDYTDLIASEGWIPSVSLRYGGIDASELSWLDSVTPYVEWSSILKANDEFNNSSLWTIGASWYWGGVYVYTDLGFSDGNWFVGQSGDFGANSDTDWEKRFNINVRYYFNLLK
ncbi:MAG: hypothetical protein OXF33_00085 [Rhodospirillales bacterium]|nr:hypothetical protein [Rhodospirillales bacterium]